MKNYTEQEVTEMWDLIPFPFKQRLMAIAEECDRACLKHPDFPQDKIHQAAILAEEAGEVVKATLQHRYESGAVDNITTEAIQTGAMALRMLLHCESEEQREKWVRETDTQHLPEPRAGLYSCIYSFQNEMNYRWKDGEQVEVLRYNSLYEVVICRMPDQEQEFEMKLSTLLDHFLLTEMFAK